MLPMLAAPSLNDIDEAIRAIIDTPNLGVEKKGDLDGVFTYKFDCVNQQYLLAEWKDGACCSGSAHMKTSTATSNTKI